MPSAATPRADLGVGDDPELRRRSSATSSADAVRSRAAARPRGSDRRRLAETARAHDRRHRRGADVGQAVDGVSGPRQALAHRRARRSAAPARCRAARRAASGANSAQVEGSRARTVNAGAIPVSSDGCPKHSPGSSTWITSPSCTQVHRAGERAPTARWPAAPSSTSTGLARLEATLLGVRRRAPRARSASIPSNGGWRARNVSKCSMSRPRNCVRFAPVDASGDMSA